MDIFYIFLAVFLLLLIVFSLWIFACYRHAQEIGGLYFTSIATNMSLDRIVVGPFETKDSREKWRRELAPAIAVFVHGIEGIAPSFTCMIDVQDRSFIGVSLKHASEPSIVCINDFLRKQELKVGANFFQHDPVAFSH